MLLLLAAVFNEPLLKWTLAPRDYAVPQNLRAAIIVLELLFAVSGLALLHWRHLGEAAWRRLLASSVAERAVRLGTWFVPPLDGRIALCLCPVVVVDCIYACIVVEREGFPLLHPLPWLYLINKMAFDAGLYLALVALSLRYLRSRIVAMTIAYFYLALGVTDIVIYYFGYTLFERQYLAFATPYSLGAFLEGRVPLLVGAVVSIGLFVLPVYRLKDQFSSRDVLRCLAFTAALPVLNLPGTFYHISSVVIVWDLQQEIHDRLHQQLPYLAQNSVINAVRQMAYRLSTDQEPLRLTDFEDVVDYYGLPLGERRYPDLALKRFTRVIVIPVESLTLDLLGGYNPEIPEEVSPFYASKQVRVAMFRRFRTSAVPTLPGLSVLFSSHPNPALSVEQKYPQSFVRVLREAGYETIFLRSVSKFFANENRHFRNAGFDELIGAEEFEANPEYRDYVREWGACDRIVYRELVRLLEQRRDRDVFVTVLGVDTHPPRGRRDYSGLEYPPLPDYIANETNPDRRGFLRAVFYHDHDVSTLIADLKRANLWNDETLLVLTADHSAPLSGVVSGIAGYPQEQLSRIPLAFLTPQKLPDVDRNLPGSQVDFGPTLLHLLGLPVPAGFWGESLFFTGKRNPCVGVFRNTLYLEGEGLALRIPLSDPSGEREERLIRLFRGFVE